MTFWPLTNSDLPTNQTFHQFHDLYTELDLHRIMSGFHGAFATGVASQQGTLTLPDTWFRPPFWDLLMLQLLRPNSSNLPCLYSTFHLEYPLVLSRFYFKIATKCPSTYLKNSYLVRRWSVESGPWWSVESGPLCDVFSSEWNVEWTTTIILNWIAFDRNFHPENIPKAIIDVLSTSFWT